MKPFQGFFCLFALYPLGLSGNEPRASEFNRVAVNVYAKGVTEHSPRFAAGKPRVNEPMFPETLKGFYKLLWTLQMKRHLNTLYITSDDAFVRKERNTFVVEVNNKKAFQAPIHAIENIVCFGFKPLTPALMAFCAENHVGVSYLSQTGQFLARVYGAQKGNVLLRKSQYSLSDDEQGALTISRAIVAAKVTNSRSLLMRHRRNHPDKCSPALTAAIDTLGRRLRSIESATNLDELRGYEGECATLYFGVLSELITAQAKDFQFNGRNKRPPLDPVNALLSFLYALLVNDVRSALEAVGLDPQVGFLHRIRPGRPSLALDVMEELRAYVADRTMLNLINLRQLTRGDFDIRESGEVRLSDQARKTVLTAYQNRKQEEITHPLLGEKMTVGLLPHIQAQILARYIRGDIAEYPPFYVK